MAFVNLLCVRVKPFQNTLPSKQSYKNSTYTFIKPSTLGRSAIHHFNHRSIRASPVTMVLSEGTQAPAFTAQDTDGNSVSLQDFSGKNVVLYFSNTQGMGCNAQSCGFRDNEARFSALNAKIIAVSAKNASAAAAFKNSNNLPFPVLVDGDGRLQKLYDVPSTLGFLPGRVTYVIDKDGVIRSAYNNQFSMSSHIDTAKEALQKLS